MNYRNLQEYRLPVSRVSVMELTHALYLYARVHSKTLLYVIKVTLHYLMLHRFDIHSALELSRTALLCCRLAASRLCKGTRWQLSLTNLLQLTV